MQKNIKGAYFFILDEPIFIVVYLRYFIVTNIVLRFDQHLHVFRTMRVFRTIPQRTARQPAISPNSETQNSSFPCTAAFSTQQLSLHSQPQTAQTNRPLASYQVGFEG
jgi:hypothetical protein